MLKENVVVYYILITICKFLSQNHTLATSCIDFSQLLRGTMMAVNEKI